MSIATVQTVLRLKAQCLKGLSKHTGLSLPPGLARSRAAGASTGIPLFLHPKLAVSQPGDPYEQEADRVAEQVMRIPEPAVQRQCAACTAGGPPCQACEDERVRVLRKAHGDVGGEAPASVHSVLSSPGQPLTTSTRAFFEPRFGQDLSHVRVHTDGSAQQSARDVSALAYTVGSHVVFDTGRYAPHSVDGQRLLAHELTHVLQKTAMTRDAPRVFRQSAQSGIGDIGLFRYGRSDFSDLFDGEVDVRNHRVTLTMRLAINDAVSADAESVKAQRVGEFFVKARDVIQQAWSGTGYALKTACMADLYDVKVRVLLDYAAPHQTITLWNDQGERSNSTNWQLSDTQVKYRTSPVLIDSAKPPSKENVRDAEFSQIPVVHEFGHLMGLEHPVCKGNEDRCYGITFAQKNDVMGYGSQITMRDFAPFIRIMERYGRDHVPLACNAWTPVAR